MHTAVHGNALADLLSRGVDDVDCGRLGNRHHDALTIVGHRDVVRPPAQRNVLGDLAGLLVDHLERAFGLIADINGFAVGRKADAVRGLDAFDDLHDFVRGRIDHVYVIARAVRDVNARRLGGCRQRRKRECEKRVFETAAVVD